MAGDLEDLARSLEMHPIAHIELELDIWAQRLGCERSELHTHQFRHHRLRRLLEAARDWRKANPRKCPPDWYPWQRDIFAAGSSHREVLVLAGNQSGKTISTAYQDALHITGDYPDDWEGYRYDHPITCWLFGVDATQTRDVLQAALFGTLAKGARGRFSGGYIRPDEILEFTRSPIDGLVRDLFVEHASGGRSRVSLRSYRQIMTGQDTLSFAGAVVDYIHTDEQPPDDLISQLRMRLINGDEGRGGRLLCGCTPELGPTDFITGFMNDPAPNQALIGPVSWDEAPHIDKDVRANLERTLPPHELEMRSKGIPYLSGGRIFELAESRITCDPFEIPRHYKRLCGVDIGIGHKTAVVWCAWDPDSDIIYTTQAYGVAGELPAYHAARIRQSSPARLPVVFPHDVEQREKGSGHTIMQYYRSAGIDTAIPFENVDGSIHVEPGIMEMQTRLRNGTLKVFSNIDPDFWHEFRLYRRDKRTGRIVAEGDDIMSAWRYAAIMVARHGRNEDEMSRKIRQIRYNTPL